MTLQGSMNHDTHLSKIENSKKDPIILWIHLLKRLINVPYNESRSIIMKN